MLKESCFSCLGLSKKHYSGEGIAGKVEEEVLQDYALWSLDKDMILASYYWLLCFQQ